MASEGKSQLLITFVATPDKVGEMDRLVSSHAKWMAETHHREGSKALLSYNFSKGPELAYPLDPGSEPTGNTRYPAQGSFRNTGPGQSSVPRSKVGSPSRRGPSRPAWLVVV